MEKAFLPALAVLVLGTALSIFMFFILKNSEEEKGRVDFTIAANQHSEVIKDQLSNHIGAIQSIAALYAASENVTRMEFSKFAQMEMAEQPNIQALEWIPRVKASDRGAFESRARTDGLADFAFTERHTQGGMSATGERNEYYPVYYVEPIKGNEIALGFDLASNPARLEALNAARDSGELKATARITLVQETGEQYGLLVFQPIYRGGAVPETLNERRETLIGFGLVVLRISDILGSVKSGRHDHEEMDTFVFDESAPPGQQVIFPVHSTYQTQNDLDRLRCMDIPLQVGGRSWNIVNCAPEEYDYLAHHAASLIALLGGLLITAVLSAYLRALAQQRASTHKFLRHLQASEVRYRDVVDNTQVLIQSIDAGTGKLLFANNGWLSVLGYTQSDVTNLSFTDVIHPDLLEHCKNVFKQAVSSGESLTVKTTFVTREGKNLQVEGHIVCRKNELGQTVTHGIFSDVSELDRARAEQERLDADPLHLIDTANAPIFGIDVEGHVNEWNQTAERITGYSKTDVMGHDLVNELITDEYMTSVKQVLDRALRGEQTANYEFQLYTKSGNQVDVLLNSTTRRDATGAIVGVVGIGQDITDRKRAEAQVIQASKMATLGEMATSVAHELNQPLNVIRMAAGNSLRKIGKGKLEAEYLSGKLERIAAQTERAASIIDHMRMFGRKASEGPSLIDPRDVVQGAFDLMGEQLRLADIEVALDLPEACPSILGHQVQSEQVILNLLTNARDALQSREGAEEKRIAMKVETGDDETVRIIVEDSGGGIPDGVIERIFEPFYTTKEIGKGTGLGLSISYGIIRDMGGTIEAGNTDQGARFVISLPAAG